MQDQQLRHRQSTSERVRSVAQAGDAVQFGELSSDSRILSACLSEGSKCLIQHAQP
jgi:hypothetical protein